MSDDQPYFRFNPGAYAGPHPAFEPSREACEVCARPCVWKYNRRIYGRGPEVSALCARCIANGALHAFLNGQRFQLHDTDVYGAEPNLADEVLRRTPGIHSFQGIEWPVLDAKPLVFVGYGEDERLLAIDAVRIAMDAAWREVGKVFNGPTSYMLIFKELDGERYRAVIDLD